MAKTITDSRSLLRVALSSRETAHQHREQAAGSLKRADTVLAAVTAERDRAQTALSKAEQSHAGVIAQAIKKGTNPDVSLDATTKSARSVLAEIESRLRTAQHARDQLAAELSSAENEAVEAEQAAVCAAEGVIISDVEQRCSLDALNAAIKTLVDTDDLVSGLTRLDIVGIKLKLPANLGALVDRLRGVHHLIAPFKPDRAITAPAAEDETMRRFQNYRDALVKNPETTLDQVPVPKWEPPPPPSINLIEKQREAFAARIAAVAR